MTISPCCMTSLTIIYWSLGNVDRAVKMHEIFKQIAPVGSKSCALISMNERARQYFEPGGEGADKEAFMLLEEKPGLTSRQFGEERWCIRDNQVWLYRAERSIQGTTKRMEKGINTL